MSTTYYNPNKENIPPAQVPGTGGSPNEGSRAGKPLDSHLLPRSGSHDGNYTCGHNEISDDDLITAAQRGDHQAFEELCGRHSSITKTKIFSIVRNHEDAEDALQDTLLRAYTHLSSFRRSCRFSTWLTAIGVNSALMILRKRRARRETYASTSSPDTGTVKLPEPVDRSLGPEGIYLKEQ